MIAKSKPAATTVSFSGVDGAGKSTQIERLVRELEARGLRVRILRFWDDIATLKQVREDAGHKVFKGDKGIGSPEAPVNRRDKNVRGWSMTVLRLFLYFSDALSLRRAFRRCKSGEADFIIFDRYIYDEIANLDLGSKFIQAYVRFLLSRVPRPDLSFVLDADPEAARARKPEYPLEFIRFNRENYLKLARMLGWLVVVPPAEIELAHRQVLGCSLAHLQSGGALAESPFFAASVSPSEFNAPGTGQTFF